MKEEWISKVEAVLLPKLLGDVRFEGSASLAGRFRREVATWKQKDRIRPVIEIGNELAAAECLLDALDDGDRLLYEPKMAGTKKLIDFCRRSATGLHDWVEVKTVAPRWIDDDAQWRRFLKIAEEFPPNARLVVDREWAGAAIAGQSINSRLSFIRRTVEVEAQASVVPNAMKGPISLLFCSTGSDWHPDELEDFADFYRKRKPREDDPLQNATKRFMKSEGMVFNGSLAGFHYLGRGHEEVSAHCFRMNLTGPSFGS